MTSRFHIRFGYHNGACSIPFSDQAADLLCPEPVPFSVDRQSFDRDLGRRIPASLSVFNAIAVVVADKTRKCGYDVHLPWIVDLLCQKGAKREAIRFYIAYGTHSRQSDSACRECYGPVYDAFPFIHHDCDDASLFTSVGTTGAGTPARFRKDILKADLLITFGALSHHYFAGYGGGRKLIFPGLGFRKDIYRNHSLFLEAAGQRLSPGCRSGNLEKNPVAWDLQQVDAFLPDKVGIHGILDETGRVCRLIVTRTYDEFVGSCRVLDRYYKAGTKKRYDLVVASAGGFPRDINFIQAHKAVHNAAGFVKTGGLLILFAACPDGIGSDRFLEYFTSGSFAGAFERLKRDYKGNGTTALSLMSKTDRIHICMHTELDRSLCRMMGLKKRGLSAIDHLIGTAAKEGKTAAYIENAGLLIPGDDPAGE